MAALAALAPAAISAGTGVFQLAKAKKLREKADSIDTPALIDPLQSQLLSRIDRLRGQVRSGTDTGTLAARDAVRRNTAQLGSTILKSSSNPAVVKNLLSKTTRAAGQTISDIAASSTAKEMQLLGAESQVVGDVAERAKNIQFWKKIQALREAEEMKKSGQQNLGAGAISLATEASNQF